MFDFAPNQDAEADMRRRVIEVAETPINPLCPYVSEYLAQMRSLRPRVPEGWAYRGMEDFLLKHGRAYAAPSKARPRGVKKEVNKYCFDNAYRIAKARGWIYVEGVACGMFPMHHAWCIRPADSLVVDVTWKDAATEYFGVPFTIAAMDAVRTDDNASMLLRPVLYKQPFEA